MYFDYDILRVCFRVGNLRRNLRFKPTVIEIRFEVVANSLHCIPISVLATGIALNFKDRPDCYIICWRNIRKGCILICGVAWENVCKQLDFFVKLWFFNWYFSPNAKTQSIALLNAETVLHDYWGGAEYWMARRSMRFNSFLVETANNYRHDVLNSTDAFDGIDRPDDWRNETVLMTNFMHILLLFIAYWIIILNTFYTLLENWLCIFRFRSIALPKAAITYARTCEEPIFCMDAMKPHRRSGQRQLKYCTNWKNCIWKVFSFRAIALDKSIAILNHF